MNWIAYIHLLTKTCRLPSVSISGFHFADKESAELWVKEQEAKYGHRVLMKKVVANEAI